MGDEWKRPGTTSSQHECAARARRRAALLPRGLILTPHPHPAIPFQAGSRKIRSAGEEIRPPGARRPAQPGPPCPRDNVSLRPRGNRRPPHLLAGETPEDCNAWRLQRSLLESCVSLVRIGDSGKGAPHGLPSLEVSIGIGINKVSISHIWIEKFGCRDQFWVAATTQFLCRVPFAV